MRRITWIVALVLGVTLVLAGCGKKDASTVVNDLDKLVGSLESYQASGTMTLQTGQEPQDYQVEVWYKSKHFYRISLVNEKKDISQIVLRNDEGVFVLTPHLNKSFRFQSDWPENQGQVYLYQSLVKSIIADKTRQFTIDNGAYVFDVVANYQNASNFARQRIWLDKKNYAPQHVEVSDANANIKVIVDFKTFEFGKKFDKDSFDMKRNMTAWNMITTPAVKQDGVDKTNTVNSDAPVTDPTADAAKTDTTVTDATADAAKTGKTVTDSTKTDAAKTDEQKAAADAKNPATDPAAGADAKTDGKTVDSATNPAADTAPIPAADPKTSELTFGLVEPGYIPQGVQQQEIKELTVAGAKALLMRYTGDYHYSILESKPQAHEAAATALNGEIVDLGFTLGVITGDELKTLEWMYSGIEFKLSTGDLPKDEMIKIAMAVEDQSGK
jgi:outer membrane lipoprotein-sorting protein